VAPETPEGVAGIVDLSLAFSRDARYPDARTMRADVQAVRRGAAPPYATQRLATRDERTRADLPAFSAATQPLDTVREPTGGRTVPLAAYTDPTAPYPVAPLSSSPAVVEVPPVSARAPISRTEPLAQVPARAVPATYAGAPSVTAPAPAPYVSSPAALPGAPPAAVTQQPPRANRGLLALFVVLGTLAVASAGGLVAYLMLAESPTASQDAATIPLPAPLPALEPATANVKPTAEAARGAAPPATDPAAPQPRARSTSREPARPDAATSASARASAIAEPTSAPTPTPAPTPSPTPTPTVTTTATVTATTTASAAAPVPAPSEQTNATRDAGTNRVHRRGRPRD
jgi:hypothetical protein